MSPVVTPLITTVLPTYRRPKLLARALDAVLGQKFEALQVCVYDDNSGDETQEIVREFMRRDGRVKYFAQPKNLGMISNTMFGIARVDTPYFAITADDDLLLPDYYSGTVEALERDPECAFAAARVIMIDVQGRLVGRPPDYFPAGRYSPPNGLQFLIKRGFLPWSGIVWRTESFRGMGKLDSSIGYDLDLEFEMRVANRHPYRVIDVPGAVFTQDDIPAYRRANRYLLTAHQQVESWCERVTDTYGLPAPIAEECCTLIRRRYATSLYRNAMKWAGAWSIADLEQAGRILEELQYSRRRRLQTLIFLGKLVPGALRLITLIQRLKQSKIYLALKQPKSKAKYGGFLAYESLTTDHRRTN